LGFAVAAGSVAAVNPCGFAMLPAYLTLVVVGAAIPAGDHRGDRSAPHRTRRLDADRPPGQRGAAQAATRRADRAVGLDVRLWAGLCIHFPVLHHRPLLAVTSATFRSGSILGAVVAYLAYGAGMALVVLVLTTTVALAGQTATTHARRLLSHINRIGGALLVLVGSYLGYYGMYELRLYVGGADARDPVIEAAGTTQSTLQLWVDGIGVWPDGPSPGCAGARRCATRLACLQEVPATRNASDSRQAGCPADRGQT
jgi:hypothetical protein